MCLINLVNVFLILWLQKIKRIKAEFPMVKRKEKGKKSRRQLYKKLKIFLCQIYLKVLGSQNFKCLKWIIMNGLKNRHITIQYIIFSQQQLKLTHHSSISLFTLAKKLLCLTSKIPATKYRKKLKMLGKLLFTRQSLMGHSQVLSSRGQKIQKFARWEVVTVEILI